MKKILQLQELLPLVRDAQAKGKSVVHCHGCFDIVHPGHIRYLEFAKNQGDILVVSLTGDSQIAKDVQRPYIPQELRAENLAALQAVDYVYIDPNPTATQLLEVLRPDFYVKGREYEQMNDPNFTAERDVVNSYGGRVIFSSGDVVFSSTRLIEQLAPDRGFEFDRFSAICRRHDITAQSIDRLLSDFAEKRVLVVGDLIIDRYVLCDATDLASEAAMMSLTRLEEQVYVGGAGIVARHLAGLGATPYLLSATGHDEHSAMAQNVLENESITTRLIPCRDRLPEKTRFLVETSKLLRVEDGQSHPLDSVAEQKAFDWITSISGGFDAVVFCDFGYGTITGGLWDRMQRWLRRKVGVVLADVSGQRGRLTRFKHVNLLCPTERELRTALHDFESGLSSVAWKALEQTQARQLMVTLGKKGLVVFDRQSQDANRPEWRGRLRSEYLPTLADRVVDPLGCGDSLLAATTMALTGGGNLMQAAYLGSVAAAWQIGRLGNQPFDAANLRRFLDTRPEMVPASPLDYGATETTTDHGRFPVSDEVDLLSQAQKWRDQNASVSRNKWKPSLG